MNIKLLENPQRCITNILVVKTIIEKKTGPNALFKKKHGLNTR